MSNAYRLLTGKFGRVEESGHKIYQKGDTVRDLSADQVARLAAKGMIEAVSVAVPVVEPENSSETKTESQTDASSVLDGHWRAVVKTIEGIDEAEKLEALLAEENARESPRRAVLKALTEKLGE